MLQEVVLQKLLKACVKSNAVPCYDAELDAPCCPMGTPAWSDLLYMYSQVTQSYYSQFDV